jgi:hypothetical protein
MTQANLVPYPFLWAPPFPACDVFDFQIDPVFQHATCCKHTFGFLEMAKTQSLSHFRFGRVFDFQNDPFFQHLTCSMFRPTLFSNTRRAAAAADK